MSEVAVTMRIDSELYEKIKKLAEEENRSALGQIRQFLAEGVELRDGETE